MYEVDRRAGAVLIARRADRLWVPEAAQVLVPRRQLDRILIVQQGPEHMAQEEFGIAADHVLRQAATLDQKEPVPTAGCRLLVDRLETVERRHDVEQCHTLDAFRMVARQSVGDPRPAVVPGYGEALEGERAHRFDLVEGQRTLRMCCPARRAAWSCRYSRAGRAQRR